MRNRCWQRPHKIENSARRMNEKGRFAIENRSPTKRVRGAGICGTSQLPAISCQANERWFPDCMYGFSRIVRLGEGVSELGALSDEAVQRTIEALKICAQKMSRQRVSKARCGDTGSSIRKQQGIFCRSDGGRNWQTLKLSLRKKKPSSHSPVVYHFWTQATIIL